MHSPKRRSSRARDGPHEAEGGQKVVDEGLVAGDMHLPHHEAATRQPLAIALAECRLRQVVGMALEVLLIE